MDTSTLPTKNNLMRLKGKIKQSEQGQQLLEKKKVILELELEKVKKDLYEQRNILSSLMQDASMKLKYALVDVGIDELMNISEDIDLVENVDIKYKTIMGVEIPSVVFKEKKIDLDYGLYGTSMYVDECIVSFDKVKSVIVRLAELENTFFRLQESIKGVQKRSNALKNVIIPKDKVLEKNIVNILEEREREEFTRMKVLKGKV